MSAAWFSYPLAFDASRTFSCENAAPEPDLDPEQCQWFQEWWHFWYVADLVFGLATVAFFVLVVGVFSLGQLGSYLLRAPGIRASQAVQKCMALLRYLSYRGYHIQRLRWYSAPLGLLIVAFIGTVFFLCLDLIPQPYYFPSPAYGYSPPLGTRSAWMALACMPFVFATASKTNWITLLTGVSHERLMVFHKWISYVFFLLALVHTFSFIVSHTASGDLHQSVTVDDVFVYWTGIVALILQTWLTIASHSIFRGRAYEFFKFMHFFLVVPFVITFFWHCAARLTSWNYFIATAAIYVPCILYSIIRTLFRCGFGVRAQISIEENGFIRIRIPGDFAWSAGQHCFLRFLGTGTQALTSHPFAVSSIRRSTGSSHGNGTLVFYLRCYQGLTATLFKLAKRSSPYTIRTLVDGPYGGVNLREFHASNRVLLIAGGSGATLCLALLESFLDSYAVGNSHENRSDGVPDVSKQVRLRLVLAVKETSTYRWFVARLRDIAIEYGVHGKSAEAIYVDLYITRENENSSTVVGKATSRTARGDLTSYHEMQATDSAEEKRQPSISHTLSFGRPELPQIIREEAESAAAVQDVAKLGVFTCGPASMQNDIRNAVAAENLAILKGRGGEPIYLHQEHFSWT